METPKKNRVLLPTERLANEVASEWQNQKDIVEPSKMPLSRLANSAIDKVRDNFDSIVLNLVGYGDTDLVCYRAETPKDLVSLQDRCWDPILIWAKDELGVQLRPVTGITYKAQEPFQIQKLFFNGNFFFTLVFAISFYLVNHILEIRKIRNFLLLLILLFFELDNYFYMETFDPLFLICFFLLFEIKILFSFFDKNIIKKTSMLFAYLSFFYLAKLLHLYL